MDSGNDCRAARLGWPLSTAGQLTVVAAAKRSADCAALRSALY